MDDKERQEGPSEEEIEELIKELKELEKERNKNKKKRPRGIIAIEFGGVYHPNRVINFVFSMLINVTLSYVIISLFNFANFETIYYFLGFILTYSIIEWYIRDYITHNHLQYVIKTFGMVFYFTYLLLLYIIDIYVFVNRSFEFKHETQIVAFLTIFVIVRYIMSVSIRRYFRRQIMR